MERIARRGSSIGWGVALTGVVALIAVILVRWHAPIHDAAATQPTATLPARDPGASVVASTRVHMPPELYAQARPAAVHSTPPSESLEARFRGQPQDAASLTAEDALLKAVLDQQLATSGITPRTPDVSCRQVTCRITATFRSQADAVDWATLYMTVASAELGSATPLFVARPEGGVEMRLYANRRPK